MLNELDKELEALENAEEQSEESDEAGRATLGGIQDCVLRRPLCKTRP